MRSRFSAFVLGNSEYLRCSWHPSKRPEDVTLDDNERWLALDIIASSEEGATGWVHFRATRQSPQGLAMMEERSRFVREKGHWYYWAGSPSIQALKIGRNAPCPCGSTKKFKQCCG